MNLALAVGEGDNKLSGQLDLLHYTALKRLSEFRSITSNIFNANFKAAKGIDNRRDLKFEWTDVVQHRACNASCGRSTGGSKVKKVVQLQQQLARGESGRINAVGAQIGAGGKTAWPLGPRPRRHGPGGGRFYRFQRELATKTGGGGIRA
jgi:hypothetical protein